MSWVFFHQPQCVQHSLARGPHIGLAGTVDFQQAVLPLHHLHPRLHIYRFDGNIGQPVDFNPRRDFNPQAGIPGQG
jgi:hypothetical protein